LTSAYLLVAHGSRNPDYRQNLEQLAQLVRQQLFLQQSLQAKDRQVIEPHKSRSIELLTKPEQPLVYTACLELSTLSLHQQILDLLLSIETKKIKRLIILPLFLTAGVHVREDLPQEIALAQSQLRSRLRLEMLPYLGCNPNLGRVLTAKFEALDCQQRLLLAHGSRRDRANDYLEAIAKDQQASIAYWSIPDSLAEKVTQLGKNGAKSIAILPYFLFVGKIGVSITLAVRQLQTEMPQIRLRLGEPLGGTIALARLIAAGIEL
jgi:sirohydrochlorin cobaltochelatase